MVTTQNHTKWNWMLQVTSQNGAASAEARVKHMPAIMHCYIWQM